MKALTWATKYRPKRFEEVVGQTDKVFLFNAAKKLDSAPPVILLCGPSGVGKTTVARIFAAAVNCEGQTGEPCGECASCSAVFDTTHPFVYEVDSARHATADDMRILHDKAYIASSSHKVFILDEIHAISPQAWNVLLKVLEEPLSSVTFLLLTSEPNKVPAKIRTRAMKLSFPLLTKKQIEKCLRKIGEAEEAPENVMTNLDTIIDYADGSCREAIMAMEQATLSGPEYFSGISQTLQAFDVLHALAIKDTVKAMEVVENMYYRTGDPGLVLQALAESVEKMVFDTFSVSFPVGAAMQSKISLVSGYLDDIRLFRLLEVLAVWTSRVQSRVHLSLLVAAMGTVLHGGLQAQSSSSSGDMPTKDDKMVSTADLQNMFK